MRALRKTVPTTMTQDRRRHTWLQTSLTLTLFRYGTKTEQCTGRVRNRLRLRLPHRRGQGAADPSVLRGLARWEHSSPPPSTAATRVPWKLTPCLILTAHPRWSTALPSRTIPTSLLLDAVRPQRDAGTDAPTVGRRAVRGTRLCCPCCLCGIVLEASTTLRRDVKTKTPWAIDALCIIIIRIVGYGGLDASACFLGFPAAGVPDKRFHHQQLSEERRVRPGPVRGWYEPTPTQT